MTDTNPYGSQTVGDDYLRKPTSSGRTIPTMQVRDPDPDGNAVPIEERLRASMDQSLGDMTQRV